jgi:hypothetical protein
LNLHHVVGRSPDRHTWPTAGLQIRGAKVDWSKGAEGDLRSKACAGRETRPQRKTVARVIDRAFDFSTPATHHCSSIGPVCRGPARVPSKSAHIVFFVTVMKKPHDPVNATLAVSPAIRASQCALPNVSSPAAIPCLNFSMNVAHAKHAQGTTLWGGLPTATPGRPQVSRIAAPRSTRRKAQRETFGQRRVRVGRPAHNLGRRSLGEGRICNQVSIDAPPDCDGPPKIDATLSHLTVRLVLARRDCPKPSSAQ